MGCGRPHYPGIYAKLSQYTEWVEELTIEDEQKSKTVKNKENGTLKASTTVHLSTFLMLFGTTFVAKVIL